MLFQATRTWLTRKRKKMGLQHSYEYAGQVTAVQLGTRGGVYTSRHVVGRENQVITVKQIQLNLLYVAK